MEVPIKRFGCAFCEKGYIKQCQLDDHLRGHIQEKPFQCHLCEKSFTAKYLRHIHFTTHKTDKPYSCSVCGNRFKFVGLLNRHLKCHVSDKPHGCGQCDRTFRKKSNLKRHEIIHTKTQPISKYERNICMFCHKSFPCESELFTHLRSHVQERPFECKICYFSSNSVRFLRAHQATHNSTTFKCNQCDKVLKSYKYLRSHKKRVHERNKSHYCVICKHACYTQADLTAHMRRHTGERLHACEICNKRFTHVTRLKLHRSVHFPELRKQQSRDCQICGKNFRSTGTLREHLKYTHSDLRPFPCQLCTKSFKSPGDFRSHLATHTREKIHKCRFCTKTFTTFANRHSHERKVHKLGNPEIRCEICQKSVQKLEYKEHLMRHRSIKPHGCVFCDKRFVRRSELFMHIKSHIKERSIGGMKFSCVFCGKFFRIKRDLRAHIPAHISERPFFCPRCGLEEKWKQLFRRHLRQCSV